MYLLFSLFLLLSGPSEADTESMLWARFRGSDGLGTDLNAMAPTHWEDSDYLWKIALPGTGHSSPVVWGKLIFVSSADDASDAGFLMAIDEQNGGLLWKKEFRVSDLVMHVDNNLASPSPAVDESQVYTIWYTEEKTTLHALTHDGELQWQAEFDGIEARHGGGSSLMLTDTYVIFTREQEQGSSFKSTWVAVNKQSGKVGWELERESGTGNSFSTPILVNTEVLGPQLIFTSWAHGFTSVDPESGKVLWERKDLLTHRVVASPVHANGIIVGCRKGETVALALDPNTNMASDSILYSLAPNLSPYVPTPIAVGELLFLFTDGGSVACVHLASGEVLWKERPAGPIYGSPVNVGGNLYCITKEGEVIVIAAESSYKLLGIHALGEGSFSTPAMCNSGMVFRTVSQLMLLGR